MQDLIEKKKERQEKISETYVHCNLNPDMWWKVEQLLWVLKQKLISKCPLAKWSAETFKFINSGNDSSTFMTGCESLFACYLFPSALCILILCHGNSHMTVGRSPGKMNSFVAFLEPKVR